MPPLNPHRRTDSHPYRASILPQTPNPYGTSQPTSLGGSIASTGAGTGVSVGMGGGGGSSASMSAAKQRQYAHLHSQLAQLNANLADTENLLRMTAVQAGDMRFLGGYVGALFMGSAKVIGEEGVKGQADGEVKVKRENEDEE